MNTTNMNTTTKTRSFPAAFGKQQQRGGGPRRPYHPRPPTSMAPAKKVEPTVNVGSEIDFPSLGGGKDTWSAPAAAAPAAAGAGGKSFAALATSWKETDDADEERREYERQEAEREAEEYSRFSMLRRFPTNSHCVTSSRLFQYEEDVDEDEGGEEEERYDAPPRHPHSADDDGWNVVQRPIHRTKPSVSHYDDEACDEDDNSAW